MNSKKAIHPEKGGWLFVLIICSLTGCATTPDRSSVEPGIVALRRTSQGSFLTFESMVGETGTVRKIRFVVDTGAEVSGILHEHAQGLTVSGDAVPIIGMHGGRLDGRIVRSLLRSPNQGHLFGDAQPVGAELVVFPQGTRLPGSAQGLVGIDFLRAHASRLDIGTRRLAAVDSPDQQNSGVHVPLLRSSSDGGSRDLRFVRCEYRGKPLVWLLDTGASQTLLAQSTAKKIGALGTGWGSHLIDSGGHRVSLRHSVLRGTRWGAGDAEIGNLSIGIVALPHLASFRLIDGSPINGVLGIDMLTRHAVVIDFQRDQMWLNLSP